MDKKDARTKVMSEVLQGVRLLKFFAWERAWADKIEELRNAELETIERGFRWRILMNLIWSYVPLMVTAVSFAFFTLFGNVLTADKAFSSLALFNLMRIPLNTFPLAITALAEARVSLSRLTDFLQAEELDPKLIERVPPSPLPLDASEDVAVELKAASFRWGSDSAPLGPISVRIPRGSLVAIVGEVGAGKSSLLQSLLGEMPKRSGHVAISGSVCYVPQQAWMANATVRENITFGRPFDQKRYDQIVRTCELLPDFQMLPGGDKTEIGEKGINLSGGQKQVPLLLPPFSAPLLSLQTLYHPSSASPLLAHSTPMRTFTSSTIP